MDHGLRSRTSQTGRSMSVEGGVLDQCRPLVETIVDALCSPGRMGQSIRIIHVLSDVIGHGSVLGYLDPVYGALERDRPSFSPDVQFLSELWAMAAHPDNMLMIRSL